MEVMVVSGKAAASTSEGNPAPQPRSASLCGRLKSSGKNNAGDNESATCRLQKPSSLIAVRLTCRFISYRKLPRFSIFFRKSADSPFRHPAMKSFISREGAGILITEPSPPAEPVISKRIMTREKPPLLLSISIFYCGTWHGKNPASSKVLLLYIWHKCLLQNT